MSISTRGGLVVGVADKIFGTFENGESVAAPPLGADSVDVFERLGRRQKIFQVLEDEIKTAWEASDEVFRSTATGSDGGVRSLVCAVADPCGIDCPLVYVSPSFEDLTGYHATWAVGRNCRFLQPKPGSLAPQGINKSELARLRDFCRDREGSILTLLLNKTQNGRLFWNLLFMEHVTVGQESIRGMGARYIFAVQTELTVQRPMLNEMVLLAWDGLGPQRLERLRELLAGKGATYVPKERSLFELCASTLEEWANEVNVSFSPRIKACPSPPRKRMTSIDDFTMNWPSLVDAAARGLKRIFGYGDEELHAMRFNLPGCVVCCVADASAKDCPLVFVSRGFEEMTAYTPEHTLGRNCRFLQPGMRDLNAAINGEELQRLRAFSQRTDGNMNGRTIVGLLLNERQTGERFWNLLHMMHVHVEGRPYILGVQTSLDVPMPSMLRTAHASAKLRVKDEVHYCSFIEQVAAFLRDIRPLLDGQGSDDIPCAVDLATRKLVGFLKESCEDFEGDHWVPNVGEDEASLFHKDVTWKRALEELQSSLYKVWEVSCHCEEDISICIADPRGEDCPLVYVSPKFEALTGYAREWAIGRNCRFLQPNSAYVNGVFNKSETSLMRAFCEEPQAKGMRSVNLLINERKDRYPFLNLLVMEHIEVLAINKAAPGGPRMERRPYIFGVQTPLDSQTTSLVEVLALDIEALRHLARLRQILRSREGTLGHQSLQTFARECIAAWLQGMPLTFSLPKVRLGAPSGWCKGTVPAVGLEVTTQTLLEAVPDALEEGVRHFYLGFPAEDRHLAEGSVIELHSRLLALRLGELFSLLQPGYYHYLRAGIALTLVTPPLFVRCVDEIFKAVSAHGYDIDVWLLDVRGVELRKDVSDGKLVECWQVMSAMRRAGNVGVLGVCGAGRDLCDRLQGSVGASPLGAYAVEHYPGKIWTDAKEKAHYDSMVSRGALVMCYNIFGSRQQLLESESLRAESLRLGTDPAILLMRWAEAQGHAMMVPRLRASSPCKARRRESEAPSPPGPPEGRAEGLPHFHRSFAKEYTKVLPGACADLFRALVAHMVPPEVVTARSPKVAAGSITRRGSLPVRGSTMLSEHDDGTYTADEEYNFTLAVEPPRLRGVTDDTRRRSTGDTSVSAELFDAGAVRGTMWQPIKENSSQGVIGAAARGNTESLAPPRRMSGSRDVDGGVTHEHTLPVKPSSPAAPGRFVRPARLIGTQGPLSAN